MLKIGNKLPAFSLDSSDVEKVSSKDLLGHFAVFVIYPRNSTPGWNRQLAALEERRTEFENLNTKVFGLNFASITSHQNYCSNKGFNFPLLSDPDEKIIAKFKAQKPEGKGVLRTVYAIDVEGNIIYAERGMGNYDDIIALIKSS